MANRYKLTLSPLGCMVESFGTKIAARELDVMILDNLLCIAANGLKGAVDVRVCVDFIKQIRDLKSNDSETIILDDTDLKNLMKGIEDSVGQRPLTWFASPLWKQFDCIPKDDE